MPGGSAHGVDRDYQVLCRDILIQRALPAVLVPLSGDGIDVPVRLGSAERVFDVALSDGGDKIVVAECKRTMRAQKLTALDAFAHRVCLLRRQTGHEVAAVFFTKTAFQAGVVKAAQDEGIDVAVCRQGQPISSFSLLFNRYDPQTRCRYGLGEGDTQGAAVIAPRVES